jgi:hypothetical protein
MRFPSFASLATACLLSFAAEGAMQYTIELYPVYIAKALAEFAKRAPGGESVFVTRDLVIGHNHGSGYRLGVAERRPPDAKDPVEQTYYFEVDDKGALKPIEPPDRGAMRNERIWPGDIVPALLVGFAAHGNSPPNAPGTMVAWRVLDDTVTVMFVPGRTEADGAVVGGTTSLGREIHYHVSRSDRKLIRTTGAR